MPYQSTAVLSVCNHGGHISRKDGKRTLRGVFLRRVAPRGAEICQRCCEGRTASRKARLDFSRSLGRTPQDEFSLLLHRCAAAEGRPACALTRQGVAGMREAG